MNDLSNKARLLTARDISQFITGGRAVFTVVSRKTGKRFTYRVASKKGKEADPNFWFVSLLIGSNNTDDYKYLCTMRKLSDGRLVARHSSNSCRGAMSVEVIGLQWVLSRINRGEGLGISAEFWHEGKCSCCSRSLTVPSSIASGIGPVCARKRGM